MSDTPISDSTAHNVADLGMLCRRLERELTVANEMFRKLNLHTLNLTDRIKRLEKSGDNLNDASEILEAGEDPNGFEKLLIAQRAWRKAKEAKP
jgi:hypothetical protein